MDTVTLIVSLLITTLIVAVGYWWYRKNRPNHTFIGIDFGANSVQPRRIKNLFGPFRVKRNDGQKVNFPVPQGYAISRQDGKGTIFLGDLQTGQLLKPTRNGELFEAVHGIFMEKAFSDGRVQQIVSSTKGGIGLKLEHIAVMVGITFMAVLVAIYMYARGGGIA